MARLTKVFLLALLLLLGAAVASSAAPSDGAADAEDSGAGSDASPSQEDSAQSAEDQSASNTEAASAESAESEQASASASADEDSSDTQSPSDAATGDAASADASESEASDSSTENSMQPDGSADASSASSEDKEVDEAVKAEASEPSAESAQSSDENANDQSSDENTNEQGDASSEDSSASEESGSAQASSEEEQEEGSKSKQSSKTKAEHGATKLALGKTAMPIAHPNGMPGAVVNTAYGPMVGNHGTLNGKPYGVVGSGANALAVPMTDTFPGAASKMTIGPTPMQNSQIGPMPVMGAGPMGSIMGGAGGGGCMGGGCGGMMGMPVGGNMVHDLKVMNVPGVPKAEIAVHAPGQPTLRQGKMMRTAGDVVLPAVTPFEGGAKELGLVENKDGSTKVVVPEINGHIVPMPGMASLIDPSAVDLGVYGDQKMGHFAGITVPGPSHEDSQGDPEKDFTPTPIRSNNGRVVAVPDETLEGGSAALGVMGHGDGAKLVAIPDADPSDLSKAAKAVAGQGSKYARSVLVPGAPTQAPLKDIPITMIGKQFFAIPGIRNENHKLKMEIVGEGADQHMVAVPDGDLTKAPQGFMTNDSNAHILALNDAKGHSARVVTVGDTFSDGSAVMGPGTTLAIMGDAGSQKVVMLPKGGSDLAFAENGSVAALPDHMQPGDPLSVFKMVTGSGDKGKYVAMPGTGLAAMHDGTELALVADGGGARVVVIPKKQKNTFGRAGSITSILTAKYNLNTTRPLAGKMEAEIKKEGLEEGPKFDLPDALRGATILGYGHKMSYHGMNSIGSFGTPSGMQLPLYNTATGSKVKGKTLTSNGNGGQPLLVDHGVGAPINVQPVMLPSCQGAMGCSGSVPSVLGRSQSGPILMALLNYSVPIYGEDGKAVPGLSMSGIQHSGDNVILNQPEQGSGVPVVLGSPRSPKFLYGLGNDGMPILNLTGHRAADHSPMVAHLYATGPDGAMMINMTDQDDAKGPDGMPIKYLGTSNGPNGEPMYHPVLNVRGHYGVDDLNRAKKYVARGHLANGNPAFFDAKSGKEMKNAYVFEKEKDKNGKSVYLNISDTNDGGGNPIYVGKLPKHGEHQVYYSGKTDFTGQAKGLPTFSVEDPGPGNPRPDAPASVPVLDISDPSVVKRFGQPTTYIGKPEGGSPLVHEGTSMDGKKTMFDISKITGKGEDMVMKPTYFGAVGHVAIPPEQLHDQFNETIPAYYTYVQGKQVPVFVNTGLNKKPVMVTSNAGPNAGQSEVLTHDSSLYNPYNVSMQMYYTEVKDATGKTRKVPISWSKPHYPHESQDKVWQKISVGMGSHLASFTKQVDVAPPTVIHPPKNLLDPSGGLVMKPSDVPAPVTRPLALTSSDGHQIILPSTEAVTALKSGIRPFISWEDRAKFYNEALSPAAQKILSPDRVQCLCDDFASGEKVKCACASQPAPIMTADKDGCPKAVCPSCPISDVCPPCPKKALQWKMFPRCPQCAPCKCKICPKCDKKCASCPVHEPKVKCPPCDCMNPESVCTPKACSATPECSLCPMPNKTAYCAEKKEDPWYTTAMKKLESREEAIKGDEASVAKEVAERKFTNEIAELHRKAENDKTQLLIELDKQRKMLNNERQANRDKLDRRTFQLFELKMKEREQFKGEWEAFLTRETEKTETLNNRQAANDKEEENLRKMETEVETQEDILHMRVVSQDKDLRTGIKADLDAARMQVRDQLMKRKKELAKEVKRREIAAKELEVDLNKRETEIHAKEEEQKKREAAHSVFLTPRIQITPEDQPEMTIKPWKSPVTGGTESVPGSAPKLT